MVPILEYLGYLLYIFSTFSKTKKILLKDMVPLNRSF